MNLKQKTDNTNLAQIAREFKVESEKSIRQRFMEEGSTINMSEMEAEEEDVQGGRSS